jgi:Apea-like HEPN
MSEESFVYELLCVDSAKASKIKKAEQFAYSFMSNGELLHSPKFDTKRLQVSDAFLTLSINEIDSSSDGLPQTVFLISISGSYTAIEKARINIITHIKNQNFQTLYVLTDSVSEYIAQQIYPKINRVENRLRRYLIKFFATKLGTDWWRLTADSDMQMKAQLRKNNELIFAPHVDNRAYLIDFGELGKIIYAQSSGFISKDDIIKKILSMKPDMNSVAQLQAETQSNYTKYFKQTFKEASFQSKWEDLEKIRHKVAHNNLFTQSDSDRALKLAEELEHIIEQADQQVLKIVLSADEREAIEDIIVESIIAEDKENISDWRTEIKNALQALNGEAELSEIYEYVRVHSKRELPNSWPQIIRFTIQTNSSDSLSFRGKSDIFKKVGKGRWALRTSDPSST